MSFLLNPSRFGVPVTDPNFASVVSLMHYDGSDGSTSFVDQIGTRSWSSTGTIALSTARQKFGPSSILTSGGRLTHAASADFDMGTGDFTEEAWVYVTAAGGCPMMNNQATTNKWVSLFFDTTTSARVITANTNRITGIVTPASTWFHYALVRASGTLTAYVNGISAGSVAHAASIGGNNAISLMGSSVHTGFRGNMDDYRLTKGVARYTGNFTPSTSAWPDS